MGPNPFPPFDYHPKNEAERKLLLEYAFVWVNTEPCRLPNYHFRQLAFRGDMMENWNFQGPGIQEEIERVRSSLLKILKKYEP